MKKTTPLSKKPILLAELSSFHRIDKAIIESLEQALYRLEIEVDGQIFYIFEAPGKSLVRRNKLDLQALLSDLPIKAWFLRHNSPYDEMVGQPQGSGANELLVPLGNYFSTADDV